MIRKWLFLGLTLMLAAVVVTLLIQGRREEKKQQQAAIQPVEVVKESKPSLTRLIAPKEIGLVEEKIELSPAKDGSGQTTGINCKHSMILRNSGAAVFSNPRIRIVYLGRGGKVLDTKTRELTETFAPGELRQVELLVENVPKGTVKASVQILSADLEGLPPVAK